ncbi:MAG: FeS assembly protein SufD [candidate division Zixibacteria bacterium RBG-1]|nr:MAG: FeS assembly protein SufD [candidate division Zixibacteria bacterium RBG-1]OGC86370.1 MAG: Fe-S cluster assembly protein SufD [candidate division Zixibacteria bacterium RBG_19FT_COMBO_42_43]
MFEFEKNFTKEKLELLSKSRNEPQWVLEKRKKAFDAFQALNWPTKQEEDWRRTDFSPLEKSNFDLNRFLNSSKFITNGSASLTTSGQPTAQFSAQLLQSDSESIFSGEAEFKSSKIIFTDLDSAIKNHSEILSKYSDLINPNDGKFLAFNKAFWNKGMLLYVPKGVTVSLPLYHQLNLKSSGWGVFPYTIIIAEPNSKIILVDDYTSQEQKDWAFSDALTEIYLQRDAQLIYVNSQRWSGNVYHLLRQKAKLEANAQLITLTVNLGSQKSRSEIETELAGSGASAYIFGLTIGNGQQTFEQHTLQDHKAPHTTSDLLFKTALLDSAYAVYSGLIKVEKQAQKTDAYQANRNLLLSDKAKADTLPKLEILANDVRCTHGATVGPIDPEQFFYLISRGIEDKVAKQLLIEGFFDEVLGRIKENGFKDKIKEFLEEKIVE